MECSLNLQQSEINRQPSLHQTVKPWDLCGCANQRPYYASILWLSGLQARGTVTPDYGLVLSKNSAVRRTSCHPRVNKNKDFDMHREHTKLTAYIGVVVHSCLLTLQFTHLHMPQKHNALNFRVCVCTLLSSTRCQCASFRIQSVPANCVRNVT